MRTISTLIAYGVVTLALSGCAGTPPAGEQTASATRHTKCTPSTGSMFCNTGDDQPYGSLNAPNRSSPKVNGNLHTQGLDGG
jgi:hypothetical protein